MQAKCLLDRDQTNVRAGILLRYKYAYYTCICRTRDIPKQSSLLHSWCRLSLGYRARTSSDVANVPNYSTTTTNETTVFIFEAPRMRYRIITQCEPYNKHKHTINCNKQQQSAFEANKKMLYYRKLSTSFISTAWFVWRPRNLFAAEHEWRKNVTFVAFRSVDDVNTHTTYVYVYAMLMNTFVYQKNRRSLFFS